MNQSSIKFTNIAVQQKVLLMEMSTCILAHMIIPCEGFINYMNILQDLN